MNTGILFLRLGALLGGLGVAMGAFGAHGVDDYFAKKYAGRTHRVLGEETPTARKFLDDFKTAASYQMWHALALLATGSLLLRRPGRALTVAGWCFTAGILLFSGGLYIYTLADVRIVGMVPVPIGGTLFIAGWIAMLCGCGRVLSEAG